MTVVGRFLERKSTKLVNLVLIGGSLVFSGCQSRHEPPEGEEAPFVTSSGSSSFPPWWWWYMHRPYFSAPSSGGHIVHHVGSGGTFLRTGSTYSAARSVTGARTGGGSFKSGTSISARGGFSGGHGVAHG
jgi:hypothetical protein